MELFMSFWGGIVWACQNVVPVINAFFVVWYVVFRSFWGGIVWVYQNVIPVINAFFVVWSVVLKVRKWLCKSQLRSKEEEIQLENINFETILSDFL